MSYQAPIKDMLFDIRELAGLEQVRQLPGFEEATDDTVQAVLEEAAKFNGEVLAPLNWTGDAADRIADDAQRRQVVAETELRVFKETGQRPSPSALPPKG